MFDRVALSLWVARGRTALAFLTRLPLTKPAEGDEARGMASLAEAAGLFPLVGIVVGTLGALAYLAADGLGLPPVLAALVALGATILVTGALHEDGLADVADGFGGGFERARKLEIMRDSGLGSYGALALILSVLARLLALASLAEPALVAGALVAAHAAGRAPLPAIMAWSRPARADGLAAGAGRPGPRQVGLALALGALVSALAVGPISGLVAFAVACLGAVLLLAVARRQIGGYTGDVLGAIEQLAEILVLLTLVCLL